MSNNNEIYLTKFNPLPSATIFTLGENLPDMNASVRVLSHASHQIFASKLFIKNNEISQKAKLFGILKIEKFSIILRGRASQDELASHFTGVKASPSTN